MARIAKGKTAISIQLSDELVAFLDDKHWELRLETREMVADVILEWAKANGFKPSKSQG